MKDHVISTRSTDTLTLSYYRHMVDEDSATRILGIIEE